MNTAKWWMRRELRLRDNQALLAALEKSGQVVPVYILVDQLLDSPYVSQKRSACLLAGWKALDVELRQRANSQLLWRGDPLIEHNIIKEHTKAEAVFAEPDSSPCARRRYEAIETELDLRWVGCPAVLPPGSVLKANGEPYTVFTAFSKAWKEVITRWWMQACASLYRQAGCTSGRAWSRLHS